MAQHHYTGKSLILFDGVCNLCNRWVQFLLKHDKQDEFRFAPLQSEIGTQLLLSTGVQVPENGYTTIVLIRNGQVYTLSTAALKIAQKLPGGWQLLYLFIAIPKNIRDGIYRYISKHRYRFFGKKTQCMRPSAHWKDKFISED